MQTSYNRSSCLETCRACGYQHKTYYREPTAEELDDDMFRYGQGPFVKLSIESYMEEVHEFDDNVIKKVTIYACPRCGTLQMEAVGVRD